MVIIFYTCIEDWILTILREHENKIGYAFLKTFVMYSLKHKPY